MRPHMLDECRRRSEQAAGDFAERNADRSGERRDVYEVRGAKLLRVPQTIAQNEPSFCVGVDHLDRLARGAFQHIARPDGASARHVFRDRNHADDADRCVQLGHRAHRARHRRAAGHVVLHAVHVGRRLDRNAAGVECDALADQPEDRRLRVRPPGRSGS